MKPNLLVPDLVSHLLSEMLEGRLSTPKFMCESEPEAIWKSLLYCILSSQVRAISATNATTAVAKNVPFFDRVSSWNDLAHQTYLTLSHPAVRYRFPRIKSVQIMGAWFPFAQICEEFDEYLSSFDDERKARSALIRLVPGLGLKQASMFMRDIGYAKRLAIIDSHLLWYFRLRYGLEIRSLTAKHYSNLEDLFLEEADRFSVEPNMLDSAIWTAVRTVRQSHV